MAPQSALICIHVFPIKPVTFINFILSISLSFYLYKGERIIPEVYILKQHHYLPSILCNVLSKLNKLLPLQIPAKLALLTAHFHNGISLTVFSSIFLCRPCSPWILQPRYGVPIFL